MCIKKLKSRQIKCPVVEEEKETEDNVKQSISGLNNKRIYYPLSSRSNFLLSLMKPIIKLLKCIQLIVDFIYYMFVILINKSIWLSLVLHNNFFCITFSLNILEIVLVFFKLLLFVTDFFAVVWVGFVFFYFMSLHLKYNFRQIKDLMKQNPRPGNNLLLIDTIHKHNYYSELTLECNKIFNMLWLSFTFYSLLLSILCQHNSIWSQSFFCFYFSVRQQFS
jgi:hypothetical protein